MAAPTIVITTIHSPTPAVLQWLSQPDTRVIVVGDAPGPATYDPRSQFWDLARQQQSSFAMGRLLPAQSYARKNFGYLVAISEGAPVLYETDDDNFPTQEWRWRPSPGVEAQAVERKGWVNAYRYFTREFIWPRGLPLSEVRREPPPPSALPHQVHAPIQQSLADSDPDVDAIWRMIFGGRITFDRAPAVVLRPGAWCPFNSQSTWWHREAFPLLYLPSHCSLRMTDIWRSLIAQRCLWERGHGIVFLGPEVRQERTPHVLIKDFELEVEGYLRNAEIARFLEELSLPSGDLAANLIRCYEALIRFGVFPQAELDLVKAWLADLEQAGKSRPRQTAENREHP